VISPAISPDSLRRDCTVADSRGLQPSSETTKPPADKNAPRAQLSIGYSLLYQEADGIPKLKWILMFKDKPEEMGRVTNDLVSYYQQLADTMRRLSKQYPAMRIDVAAMSEIEATSVKPLAKTWPRTSPRSLARPASNSSGRRYSCFTTRSTSNGILG
jgi:hypothetical protein